MPVVTQSVHKDKEGPDWPLGLITVVTPGVPVSIMSLVDPSSVNDPASPTSPTSDEYTFRAQQITFQAFRAGGPHGLQNNLGNIYIVRKGVQGPGNRDDYGSVVWVVGPGLTWVLSSAALDRNVYSPYRYFIDADNALDSCLVSMLMQ